ncbi:hypothetical protein [Nannocystis pusilla]|uniref:hypothetical protein n=1 Tax=Nannocystis pusilla TaxID=889268 RepID=UPI003DA3DEAC
MSHATPPLGAASIETWSIVGAAVFGDDAPAEQKLLVDYAPCRADVLDWALDPQTSCEAPGCVDPWGAPPITWTFKTDEIESPGPTTTVQSHVPRCDLDAQKPGACTGSGAFVHLGLELVQGHLAEARTSCMDFGSENLCDAQTKFYNVLVMDGTYDSDDAAVQASLEQMFTDGVRTYVVGLGELAETPEAVEQLTMMAAWGSGGALDFFPAGDSQVELQAAFAAIFEHMFEEVTQTPIDPCCGGLGCGWLDGGEEPGEPDPLPDPSDSDGTSSTTGETTGETTSTSEAPVTTMTSATDGSTTSAGPTSDASTSAAPTTDTPTSGAPTTTDGPTTGAPTTGGQPGTSAPGESGDEPSATDTDGEAAGGDAQAGCGCMSGADGEGALASLVGLGLLGLGRRRRTE